MYDQLRNRARGLAEPAIELTRQLIRIPSESLHEEATSDAVLRVMHQTEDRILTSLGLGPVHGAESK